MHFNHPVYQQARNSRKTLQGVVFHHSVPCSPCPSLVFTAHLWVSFTVFFAPFAQIPKRVEIPFFFFLLPSTQQGGSWLSSVLLLVYPEIKKWTCKYRLNVVHHLREGGPQQEAVGCVVFSVRMSVVKFWGRWLCLSSDHTMWSLLLKSSSPQSLTAFNSVGLSDPKMFLSWLRFPQPRKQVQAILFQEPQDVHQGTVLTGCCLPAYHAASSLNGFSIVCIRNSETMSGLQRTARGESRNPSRCLERGVPCTTCDEDVLNSVYRGSSLIWAPKGCLRTETSVVLNSHLATPLRTSFLSNRQSHPHTSPSSWHHRKAPRYYLWSMCH